MLALSIIGVMAFENCGRADASRNGRRARRKKTVRPFPFGVIESRSTGYKSPLVRAIRVVVARLQVPAPSL